MWGVSHQSTDELRDLIRQVCDDNIDLGASFRDFLNVKETLYKGANEMFCSQKNADNPDIPQHERNIDLYVDWLKAPKEANIPKVWCANKGTPICSGQVDVSTPAVTTFPQQPDDSNDGTATTDTPTPPYYQTGSGVTLLFCRK